MMNTHQPSEKLLDAESFANAYPGFTVTADGHMPRADAAKFIGVSLSTLMRWHRDDRLDLKPIRRAGRIFLSLEAVQRVASGEMVLRPKGQ